MKKSEKHAQHKEKSPPVISAPLLMGSLRSLQTGEVGPPHSRQDSEEEFEGQTVESGRARPYFPPKRRGKRRHYVTQKLSIVPIQKKMQSKTAIGRGTLRGSNKARTSTNKSNPHEKGSACTRRASMKKTTKQNKN